MHVDLRVVAGPPLERAGHAVALALEIELPPIDAAGHVDLVEAGAFQQRRIGAAHERLDLDAIAARGQFRMRHIHHQAHLAEAGIPAIAEEKRARWFVGLAEIAVVHVGGRTDDPARLVERHARAQVDRAAQTAFDDLGRRVLVDVHARHQFGRHIFEAQAASAGRAEAVAAIELAAHLGHAANHHAAAFGREVVRIVTRHEVIDGHAAHPLQGFGNAAIRQGTDILGADRIDDLFGIVLDRLRLDQAGAHTAHFHCIQVGGLARGARGGILGRLRLLRIDRRSEQEPDADGHGGTAQRRQTTGEHARTCRGMAGTLVHLNPSQDARRLNKLSQRRRAA